MPKRGNRRRGPAPAGEVMTGTDVLEPLQALYHTDPHDPTARAALRRRFCATCRLTAGQPESEQAVTCAKIRCHLHNPAKLAEERHILLGFVGLLEDIDHAPADLVDEFNLYIASAGCAVIAIGGRPDGYRGLGFERASLRAVLHVAAVMWLAWRAGDRIHLNIHSASAAELERTVRQIRAAAKEEEAWLLRERAAEIYRRTGSINATAKALDRDRKDVRDWLREAGVLDPRE